MDRNNSYDIENIINYRREIYNSLSNDALKILSIQLFVFTLLISAVSLINRLIDSNGNSGTNGLSEQLISETSVTAIFVGLIFLVAGITLTVIIYYDSRRRSTKQPIYMYEQERIDSTSDNPIGYIISKYIEKEKKYDTGPREREDILESFDQEIVPGTIHRSGLLFSLIFSFYSIYRVGNGLITVAYPSFSQVLSNVIGSAVVLAIIIMSYLFLISVIESSGEKLFRVSRTVMIISLKNIEKMFIIFVEKIYSQVKNMGLIVNVSTFIALLLLLFGSSKYPSGYISNINILSLILGETLAISTICYVFLPDPD